MQEEQLYTIHKGSYLELQKTYVVTSISKRRIHYHLQLPPALISLAKVIEKKVKLFVIYTDNKYVTVRYIIFGITFLRKQHYAF